MANPVVHFDISGRNLDSQMKFYHDLFGWKIDNSNPMNYGLVDKEGEGIAGGIGETEQSRVTIFVEVDDLQAALDKAVALGGKVVQQPMEIPGVVSLAEFSDPEGNVIGLTLRQPPG